jgi:hypothetical protein
MTINAFYFKIDNETYTYFKHQGETNLEYNLAIPISAEDADWDNLLMKRVNQYAKIFTSFRIYTCDETYLAVSHGKFVSVFNIENWKWERHI